METESAKSLKVIQPKENKTGKSKSELKAERRAKQERERAAKLAKKQAEQGTTQSEVLKPKSIVKIPKNIQADDLKLRKKNAKKLEKQQVPLRQEGQKKVGLFLHLHQYDRSISITKELSLGACKIHPAIVSLGLQYAEGIISGSNARCAALLHALKKVINDYSTPPQKEISRHLDATIKPCISFLNQCRPLSISMGNAIKFIKLKITNIGVDVSDEIAKAKLCNSLDNYIRVNINLAGDAISNTVAKKIKNGDVVLIFGGSSLINKVLIDAKKNKDFSVIIADARPKLSGQNVAKKLISNGIKCTYVLINAIPFIMPQVTKVLLGAHALLSNGYVMSAVGTALIALTAKTRNIPVMVCCETYKFCERVQTDAFVNNEIGDPLDLLEPRRNNTERKLLLDRETWEKLDALKVLHLTYDITPPGLVDAVITELGMIPCSSVPVVLRLKSPEL